MRKSSFRKTKEDVLKDFQEKLNLGYNFVDYFLTIGVEPEIFKNQWLYETSLEELNLLYKEQLQPKILNQFPSFEKKNVGINDSIIQHCFPLGFQVHEFTEKPEEKVFSIILDNNNYSTTFQSKYVVCLITYESINEYRKLYEKYYDVNSNNVKNVNVFKNNNLNNSFYLEPNRLFHFNDNLSNYSTNTYNNNALSRKITNFSVLSNPISEYSQRETNISSFFTKKYYKKYYIPKCICLISLYPFISELTRIIKFIYNYSLQEKLTIPLEKIINNLILEVPIPPRGLYSIEYSLSDKTIILQNSKLNDLFYANFEFNILFSKFNSEQIIKIFQYLMLGIKIVFFSTEIECLTPIILASLILLFPFKYPFTVVSVLPKESYNLIDNIIPEVLGVNEKYTPGFFQANDIDITDHMLIADIDEQNIIPCKPKIKDELPCLPKNLKDELSKRIKTYINAIHKNMKKDKKEPIKVFQYVVRNIFLEFQLQLLKDYPKYLNSNIYKHPQEKPFKIKKFLSNVSSNDYAFYEKFIETQMFNDYILKRMTPKDKKEQTEVLFFEEKIFLLKDQKDKIVFLNSKSFNINNEYKVPKVTNVMDEEILNQYSNKQNIKNFLLDGISINLVKNNMLKLSENSRSRSMSFSTDGGAKKKVYNENKPEFNYILFPKLNNDLFFKAEIKNYYLDLSIFDRIKNINSELISKSHLSRVEIQTNEMTNFVYLLWLKVWANSFYYHDKKEQKFRYLQMLNVFNKINQHEMNVISNLFQGLIRANSDEDLIFHLYLKILQCKLSPSIDIFNSIKSIIRKKTKNSTMPSSEIAKYLSNKGKIYINKEDLNKKLFRKRTMKNIYDMYMIKEKVSFIMEEICNNCDKKIDIYYFQKNINNTNNDIVWAKCPFCQSSYLPKLKVIFGDEINKNNKLVQSTSIVDEVIIYSPKTLKMNFFDNSNIDINKLKLNYNPIFWNLIWYFKINGLPFDFILPYEENIFFKRKVVIPKFFQVNIKNENIEKNQEKVEMKKSQVELKDSIPNYKNNYLNNIQIPKTQNPNIIFLNPKPNGNKNIKTNIGNINISNNNKGRIICNVKMPINAINNPIGNSEKLSGRTYTNFTNINIIKNTNNNPRNIFINNNNNIINKVIVHGKHSSYPNRDTKINNNYIIINNNNNTSLNKNNANNYILNNNKRINNNIQNTMINNSMINNSIMNNSKLNNSFMNKSVINIPNINNLNINNSNINYKITNRNYFNNYINLANINNNDFIYNNQKRINLKKLLNPNTTPLINNTNIAPKAPYINNMNFTQNNTSLLNNSFNIGLNKNYYQINNKNLNLPIYNNYIFPYAYK